jgi:hypothetical protein
MSRGGWFGLGAATAVLAFASATAAQSGPDPLVAVLVEKGVITQADAAGVTTRDQLVKLLEAKGVLNQNDVNSIAQAEPEMLANGGAAPPPNELPVYFHEDHPTTVTLGPVDLTVGGFIDTMDIYRTSNTGNFGGTNFFAIPFDNTIQGNISENHITAANSRLSLKAEGRFGWGGEPVDAVGYFEGDFLGNDAANSIVTSNSHTFRIRQFFVDAQKGGWEVLAGQAWSWMTPNRHGLSSMPDGLFITNNYDPNYNVGLTWTRAAQFRIAYHVNSNLAVGVGLENPDNFTGQGSEVILPAAFNAQLGVQVDSANQTAVPTVFPDILAKVAYDNKLPSGQSYHLEAVGLVSQFRVTDLLQVQQPFNGPSPFTRHSTTGWGIAVNGNVQVTPSFTLLGDAFYSEGGGRYIFGMGPDFVVLPVLTTPSVIASGSGAGKTLCCFDLRLSDVASESFLGGGEWQANTRTLLSAYYGWAHFFRNTAIDATSTLATQPFIGFGGRNNSSNAANETISEATLDGNYKIWNSAAGGVLSAGLQYSYVQRSPWFIPAGAPKWAPISMFIFDVRYTLP